mmetsp:Transcript_50917/g.131276  ORF Transcript_50917/g.131276 Transcript_50917/m.131276 type:complete len:231 (+) Transcript_50917:393-1085(+)
MLHPQCHSPSAKARAALQRQASPTCLHGLGAAPPLAAARARSGPPGGPTSSTCISRSCSCAQQQQQQRWRRLGTNPCTTSSPCTPALRGCQRPHCPRRCPRPPATATTWCQSCGRSSCDLRGRGRRAPCARVCTTTSACRSGQIGSTLTPCSTCGAARRQPSGPRRPSSWAAAQCLCATGACMGAWPPGTSPPLSPARRLRRCASASPWAACPGQSSCRTWTTCARRSCG